MTDNVRTGNGRCGAVTENRRRNPVDEGSNADVSGQRSQDVRGSSNRENSADDRPRRNERSSHRSRDRGRGYDRVQERQGPRRSGTGRGRTGSRGSPSTTPRNPRSPNQVVPFGVKALCGLLVVSGLLSLYAAVVVGAVSGTIGALLTALGVGYLCVTYGVWYLRWWGWYAAVGLFGFGAVVSLLGGVVPGLLFNVALLGYLWIRSDVFLSKPREQRGVAPRRSPARR